MAASKKSASKKTATESKAPAKAAAKKQTLEERYEAVLSTADRLAGDKDPVVVAWCRENMTEEQFTEKYKGRKFSEESE